MRAKFWLICLSIALNVFFIGAYTAKRLLLVPSGGGTARPPAMLYESLDLTSGQRATFEAARNRFHGRMMAIRQTVQLRRAELLHLLAMGKPDRAAIDAKQREILNLQGELQRSVISHLLDVSAPLSQKQRDAFFALLKERMAQQMPGYPPACY